MSQHKCMWPGCEKMVPASNWGCGTCWGRLPQEIRNDIWRAYIPDQTIETMSGGYRRAIVRAHGWIIKTFGAEEKPRDPRRWEHLVEIIRQKDEARRERRAAGATAS